MLVVIVVVVVVDVVVVVGDGDGDEWRPCVALIYSTVFVGFVVVVVVVVTTAPVPTAFDGRQNPTKY